MKTLLNFLLVVAMLGITALTSTAQPAPGGGHQGGPGGPGGMRPKGEVVTLDGTVKDVTVGMPGRNIQAVHFKLTTADATVVVGLGPEAYLKQINLTLKDGDKVTVTGWKETLKAKTLVLAKTLVVGGQTYTFRNDDGKPSWNPFIGQPLVTVSGTVKEVVLPAPPTAGAKQHGAAKMEGDAKPKGEGKPQGDQRPHLVLTTENGDVMIPLAPPKYLKQIGFAPAVGDKLIITGWKPELGKEKIVVLIAQQVVAGDKTYTFRDVNGKPAWETMMQGKGKGGARHEGDLKRERPKKGGGAVAQ